MSVNNVGAGSAHDAAVLAAFNEGMQSVEEDLQAGAQGGSKPPANTAAQTAKASAAAVPLQEPISPLQGAADTVSTIVGAVKKVLTPSPKAEPEPEPENSTSDGPMAFADTSGGQGTSNSSITKIPVSGGDAASSQPPSSASLEDARVRDERAPDEERVRDPRRERGSSSEPQPASQSAPQQPVVGSIAAPVRSDVAREAQAQVEPQAPAPQQPVVGSIAAPARSDVAREQQEQAAQQQSAPQQSDVAREPQEQTARPTLGMAYVSAQQKLAQQESVESEGADEGVEIAARNGNGGGEGKRDG